MTIKTTIPELFWQDTEQVFSKIFKLYINKKIRKVSTAMNCISTHAEFICFFCDPFPLLCPIAHSCLFFSYLLKSECDDWTLGTSPSSKVWFTNSGASRRDKKTVGFQSQMKDDALCGPVRRKMCLSIPKR